MAIDTGTRVQAQFFYKWMTVRKMKEILSVLKDDSVLVPNCVGNLTVCSKFDGSYNECDESYLGYIDFNLETYEPVGGD